MACLTYMERSSEDGLFNLLAGGVWREVVRCQHIRMIHDVADVITQVTNRQVEHKALSDRMFPQVGESFQPLYDVDEDGDTDDEAQAEADQG